MKSRRSKFGNVIAFAALFATLAFVSVGVASTDTTVSQPKITFSKPMYESSITHKSLNFVPHIASNDTTSVPIIDLLDAIDQNMVAASFIGWENNSLIINMRSS